MTISSYTKSIGQTTELNMYNVVAYMSTQTLGYIHWNVDSNSTISPHSVKSHLLAFLCIFSVCCACNAEAVDKSKKIRASFKFMGHVYDVMT